MPSLYWTALVMMVSACGWAAEGRGGVRYQGGAAGVMGQPAQGGGVALSPALPAFSLPSPALAAAPRRPAAVPRRSSLPEPGQLAMLDADAGRPGGGEMRDALAPLPTWYERLLAWSRSVLSRVTRAL